MPLPQTETDHQNTTTLNPSVTQHPKAHTKPGEPRALFSCLPYYTYYILYFFGFYNFYVLYNPYWIIALVYIGIPLLDFYSYDWLNPNSQQYQKLLEKNIWFKLPLLGMIILDPLLFFFSIYKWTYSDLPWIFYPGALFMLGTNAGHHFLVAHEIFHKPSKFDKIIGTFATFKSCYMHFYIEHNHGHHKNLCTPNDPATARYRESIYQFLPRTIIGSYKSAWNIEKRRLTKLKGHKSHWVPQNKMIWFTTSYILLPLAVSLIFGLRGLALYLILAGTSVVTLETINYIEHYGLTRKLIGPNEYERVTIMHSWNAPQRFSNYILFKLQRHSDHHENSYKPYQALSSKDESPMLPNGYMLCLILSYFPQIWFRIMDRVLIAHKAQRPLTEEELRLNKRDSSIVMIFIIFIIITLLTTCIYLSK